MLKDEGRVLPRGEGTVLIEVGAVLEAVAELEVIEVVAKEPALEVVAAREVHVALKMITTVVLARTHCNSSTAIVWWYTTMHHYD